MSRITPIIPNDRNPSRLKKPAIPLGNEAPLASLPMIAMHCIITSIQPSIFFIFFSFLRFADDCGQPVVFFCFCSDTVNSLVGGVRSFEGIKQIKAFFKLAYVSV